MATSDNNTADTDEKIFIGKGEQPVWLTLALANRHGLVTGATGTGKTVSLQVMAEGFARAGVPVFAADIKGDLSGISQVGEPKDFIVKRAGEMGLTFQPDRFSTVFWDVFGEQGHPVRATVSEMGPLLLSRMMDLNDVQEGVLNVAFKVADEQGLLLLDMKDLRAILSFIAEHAADLTTQYGNVSRQTAGTIQRQLLVLENQGGARFFGEPALTLKDFMRTDSDGRGMVNILVADKLMQSPRLYATFLLWMLSELFEELPEVGDPPKPKLVFFFDEAHLLFNDAPKALMGKIEALVSFLEGNGTPAMVERVMIRPPSARIGPITPEERKAIMDKSPVKGKYDTTIDSESAYEVLQKRVAGTAASPGAAAGGGGILGQIGAIVGTIFGTNVSRGRLSTGQIIARSVTRSVTNKVVGGVVADLGKSVGGSMGSSVGRALVRGALGGLLRR